MLFGGGEMIKNLYDLSGKVAIITGASRGIGFAVAEAFALAGAKVMLSSRKQDALDQAAEKIQSQGGEAFPFAAHAGDLDSVKNLVAACLERFGGVDILVNNAATNPHFGPLLTSEESHWDKILDVNLKGYFRMIRECVECMRQRGGGKVINLASVAGIRYQQGMGIYGISKAGVLMLTKTLAVELATDNIQVNAIAPGFIQTQFSRVLWDTPEIHRKITSQIPQGRIGQPEEVTGLALYLASSASDFTTGAIMLVDGGQMAGNSLF
jgi:NAD(P)-dependent dehydrogenase (short-subunit alcohol dehydrogenase family)